MTPDPAPTPLTHEEVLDKLQDQLDNAPTITTDTETAKNWVKEFRLPLASLTTNGLVLMLQGFLAGKTDEQLRIAYSLLTPTERNAVMEANAEALEKLEAVAAQEAGLWLGAKTKLTTSAASIIMMGLSKVLMIPLA